MVNIFKEKFKCSLSENIKLILIKIEKKCKWIKKERIKILKDKLSIKLNKSKI